MGIILLWYLCATSVERQPRITIYKRAAEHAIRLNKKLLVVGGAKGRHGSGDLCLDLNPVSCLNATEFLQADIRNIPLPDKWAGVAFASHVLEHMKTPEDARQALAELQRVADVVYIVSPHKWNPMAWLHPDHWLWVSQDRSGVHFEVAQRAR